MSDLQAINAAFLDAFTEDDLSRLVKFNLDVDLASIVEGGNLRSVVFATTSWARRHGRLPALVQAAKDSTSNPLIADLSIPQRIAVMPEVEVMDMSIVESQFYKVLNDVTRIDVLLRGTGTPDDGFIGRTKTKLKEVDSEIEDVKKMQTDLLGKVGDLEDHIKRPSVDQSVMDSVYFRFIFYTFLIFAFVSLAAGGYILWTQ